MPWRASASYHLLLALRVQHLNTNQDVCTVVLVSSANTNIEEAIKVEYTCVQSRYALAGDVHPVDKMSISVQISQQCDSLYLMDELLLNDVHGNCKNGLRARDVRCGVCEGWCMDAVAHKLCPVGKRPTPSSTKPSTLPTPPPPAYTYTSPTQALQETPTSVHSFTPLGSHPPAIS